MKTTFAPPLSSGQRIARMTSTVGSVSVLKLCSEPVEALLLNIICGHDPREPLGYALFQFSAIRRTSAPLAFIPLAEHPLRQVNLYRRMHERENINSGAQLAMLRWQRRLQILVF